MYDISEKMMINGLAGTDLAYCLGSLVESTAHYMTGLDFTKHCPSRLHDEIKY